MRKIHFTKGGIGFYAGDRAHFRPSIRGRPGTLATRLLFPGAMTQRRPRARSHPSLGLPRGVATRPERARAGKRPSGSGRTSRAEPSRRREAERKRAWKKAAGRVGVGGILNLGGSIDFTIWTPPKVKNKPSQTYSTLIECLSSARLVSTHGRDGDAKRETRREGATGGGCRVARTRDETAPRTRWEGRKEEDSDCQGKWRGRGAAAARSKTERKTEGRKEKVERRGLEGGWGRTMTRGGKRVAKYRSSRPAKKQRTENWSFVKFYVPRGRRGWSLPTNLCSFFLSFEFLSFSLSPPFRFPSRRRAIRRIEEILRPAGTAAARKR